MAAYRRAWRESHKNATAALLSLKRACHSLRTVPCIDAFVRLCTCQYNIDGVLALVISVVLMFASCGLSYLVILFRILNTAKNTGTHVNFSSPVLLVFGKRLVNNSPDPDYLSRLNRLMSYQFQLAIIMGGKTGDGNITEAKAGVDYLRDRGYRISDIGFEENSSSTLENLRNTRQLLGQKTAVIISNRYHLARCGAFATSLKIPHCLCAAESAFSFDTGNISKCFLEAFYLHWFFSGKYWATLIRSQRMLDKIM